MKNSFEIRGEVTVIFIETKKFGIIETLIDTKYLQKAQEFPNSWILLSLKNSFYIQGCMPRNGGIANRVYLHRWITDADPSKVVDHINHDTFDNRKSNLRVCSQLENTRNSRIQTRGNSKFKGVHWREDKRKFVAYITINKKRKHIGYFDSEFEAAKAYNREAMKFFGKYANVNSLKG